jgi:hypothetical protein
MAQGRPLVAEGCGTFLKMPSRSTILNTYAQRFPKMSLQLFFRPAPILLDVGHDPGCWSTYNGNHHDTMDYFLLKMKINY